MNADYFSGGASSLNLINNFFKRIKFDKKQQIRFLTTLERLTRYMVLPAAIKHMRSTTVGVQADVLFDMQLKAQKGENSMNAAYDWFPPDIASALTVSDSQDINRALKSAIDILKSPTANVFKPFRWILYPLLLLSIALGLCKFIDLSILSKFANRMAEMDLPSEFNTVLEVSSFVGIPLVLALVFTAIAFSLFIYALKNVVSPKRFQYDSYPILSAYRDIVAINFLRMYSNLLYMNMPNLKALEQISNTTSNLYLISHLKQMSKALSEGGSIGNALSTGLIDDRDISTIRVLSQSRGTGFHEAVVGAMEIAIDRLEISLNRYSYLIGGSICLVTFYIVLNAVMVLFSIDVLFVQ